MPLLRRRSFPWRVTVLHRLLVAGGLLLPAPGVRAQDTEAPGLAEPGIPARAARGAAPARIARPAALPDIEGPGHVLTAGNVFMKVTNFGVLGNPYTNLSSDPSAQWPGPSGVEYLNALVLAVGAVNPIEANPVLRYRVSSGSEWRPPTTAAEDRIYTTREGTPGALQLVNDDGDFDPYTGQRRFDEEFLDGRDQDGDGRIDEDLAALGQLMHTCRMRDDTPAATYASANERHIPIGLEAHLAAWAYSVPGHTNFNAVEFTITNRSGRMLDSVYLAFPADLDAGSIEVSAGYWADDRDLSGFPGGEFAVPVDALDPLSTVSGCSTRKVRIHGFSVVDNDGDQGHTPGVVSVLLLGHTTDPLGHLAPRRVGFTTFRSYVSGTPFSSGGAPLTDRQRFELMSGRENIDPVSGGIRAAPTTLNGDYVAWNAIGPFRDLADGASIQATLGIAIEAGRHADLVHYADDYERYRAGLVTLDELLRAYPALENALAMQLAYEGVHERPRVGLGGLVPDCSGCETGFKAPPGSGGYLLAPPQCCNAAGECPDVVAVPITEFRYTWFNWDCDPCTGVRGYYLRRWDTPQPPVSPNLNTQAAHNYSDHAGRVLAAGDRRVTLAWDNVAEATPDPATSWFDFRSYRIWKVARWLRPEGATSPTDDDWMLLGEYRLFDHRDNNLIRDPLGGPPACPRVWVPNWTYPPDHPHCGSSGGSAVPLASGGCRDSATVSICLSRGDLWDRQSGDVLRPDTTIGCERDPAGACIVVPGLVLGRSTATQRTRYRIGRYRITDHEVKNGFTYFYAVTAGDSTEDGELHSRRYAREADGVVPQVAVAAGRSVWVVPNPYRGYRNIAERPSAWDLQPNATDPTGTHIDFMGLPRGAWTIRIYTVAGDLVAQLGHTDAVNAAVRSPVDDGQGGQQPGYNRQQDHADDGQARWNLISRNGQDVASGIYLFTVDSGEGIQRGRFVIIR